jgi:hypothetical protein
MFPDPFTGSSMTQIVTAPGVYQCEVISCGIVSPLSINVTSHPQVVQPIITVNPPELISSPANSYQWLFNGVEIPGATSQNYIPSGIGNYSVVITGANGCTSESDPFIFT